MTTTPVPFVTVRATLPIGDDTYASHTEITADAWDREPALRTHITNQTIDGLLREIEKQHPGFTRQYRPSRDAVEVMTHRYIRYIPTTDEEPS